MQTLLSIKGNLVSRNIYSIKDGCHYIKSSPMSALSAGRATLSALLSINAMLEANIAAIITARSVLIWNVGTVELKSGAVAIRTKFIRDSRASS
jgi:predicted nuclease with RNAse H fold